MIITSEFKPAWWLRNAHFQTILPTLTRFIKPPITYSQRLELADGDFLDLAWATANLDASAPLIILLHGLGGSIESTYACGLMRVFNQRGWRAVLMHFRGAGPEPNRLPRAYHSGDTADFQFLLQYLSEKEPLSLKAAVGVSMGGNVLLKWLGEQGKQNYIKTAVAVSVPFILNLAADRMGHGLSRLYQKYLLRQLKKMFLKKKEAILQNNPEMVENIIRSSCFWTFDELVTAPLHGFANVHDYYRKCSSYQFLTKIATPTLIINAIDDPFMTKEVLPKEEDLSVDIVLELSEKGGHVGFVSGKVPGKPTYWLEERVPAHIETVFAKCMDKKK